MKSQPIEKIRKRFKKEWLLLLRSKGRTYMTFSDDNLPMGYAAAF